MIVTHNTLSRARRIFGNYLMLTGSRRLLDKNPEIVYRIPFVRAIFPDARFIFLVRDAWDTIHSIVQWSHQHGLTSHEERHDWWGVNNRKWDIMVRELVPQEPLLNKFAGSISKLHCHAGMAAVEWVLAMQSGIAALQNYSQAVTVIHYENLTENPVDTLRELLAFCDLSEDRVFLNYAQKILTPNQKKKPVLLPDFLEQAVATTMKKLGYRDRTPGN